MTSTADPAAAEQVRERLATFSIHDNSLVDEIYDLFAQMRDLCPVAHSNADNGFWAVSRHDDVVHCLKDAGTFSVARGVSIPANPDRPSWLPMAVDPPAHTDYRRDLNVLFSPRAVKAVEDRTALRAREFLRPFVARGGGEVVSQFSGPFPCVTFLLLLGAPVEDLDQLVSWEHTLVRAIADEQARAELASTVFPAIVAYFNRLLDERAAADDPPDDFLSGILRARVGDRPYTRDEMLRVCAFLVIAGLDTVTQTLSRSIHFLAEHPGHLRQLVERPDLMPSAVEELLRMFAIVNPGRSVTRDVELDGASLRAGDTVLLLTTSAGRDERAFDHPEAVDFEREHNRHISFGAGAHRCLGSHLARMELRLALEAIVELMPEFHLDDSYPLRQHLGHLFGVDELHIVVGPRAAA
ncbi:cytochrome P450 [Dactylosporangium sp. CA-092794]|uniref:cytochrome P450 n=1 Tax=Dactylosporangium sp. CA-092794 TaxID=3239929 RepID=UPI003D8C5DD1